MKLGLIFIVVQQKWGFPGGLEVKNPPANEGDLRGVGSVPGSGRSPGGGQGNSLRCSCLESPMDRGPGGLRGAAESQTRLKRLSTHARQKPT